jgi:hypothetical protein
MEQGRNEGLEKYTLYKYSEVITAVAMSMLVFRVVNPCIILGRYQRPSSALKTEAVCVIY